MIILGIETSCDETALSIIEAIGTFETGINLRILADKTLSQIQLHNQYGGVFPSLAKREHQKNLPLLLQQTLKEAGMSNDVPTLDVIAVTIGPGLEPCLWTGIGFAEELSKKWSIPIIPVNHMEGHIFSALLRRKDTNNESGILNATKGKSSAIIHNSKFILHSPNFPALALLISGGHTELVFIKDWLKYKIVGQTRDDAVGEAFDKIARLLGLPYPGGPEISQLAEKARKSSKDSTLKSPKRAERLNLSLPRPMLRSDDFDFSFSGLKTAVLYLVKKLGVLDEMTKEKIACEFEDAVTEVLITKTKKAIEHHGAKALLAGGGVIANTHLRHALENLAYTYDRTYMLKNNFLYLPPPPLATDNALMIALTGFIHCRNAKGMESGALRACGNLRLGEEV